MPRRYLSISNVSATLRLLMTSTVAYRPSNWLFWLLVQILTPPCSLLRWNNRQFDRYIWTLNSQWTINCKLVHFMQWNFISDRSNLYQGRPIWMILHEKIHRSWHRSVAKFSLEGSHPRWYRCPDFHARSIPIPKLQCELTTNHLQWTRPRRARYHMRNSLVDVYL